VVDHEGRVLMSNMYFDLIAEQFNQRHGLDMMIKHGPSISWTDEIDTVYALPCNNLPKECEVLFKRPRPGHFPKPETLEYAKKGPVFFIPQGHPNSHPNDRKLQWRLSTTLTEQALMFDFTEIQLLVYILLKMLRIECIKPKLGDNFSTFHIKTAMLFTIEKLPPQTWHIENMVFCATDCINTLIQWANHGVCPHFTMGGVNLFDGKLSDADRKKLEASLTNVKKDIMCFICNLKMDMFGMLVLQGNVYNTKQKHQIQALAPIWGKIQINTHNFIMIMNTQANVLNVNAAVVYITNNLTNLCALQINGSELQREAADLLLPFVYGTLANIMASTCIVLRQPVAQGIINLYQLSFECDLMSGKLKYASMLYSSGQYDQAADMLNLCESLLGPDVGFICGSNNRSYVCHSYTFLVKGLNTNTVDLLRTSYTSCIKFCKHELPCVPEHLQYEMYRTHTEKDMEERNYLLELTWMDQVVIDNVPFLYYLQYLVYRKKDNLPRRLLAIFNLMDYFNKGLGKELWEKSKGHVDTALHVLAHCWELENRHDVAWHLYQRSINMFPTNNIAWVHLIRLFRKYFCEMRGQA